MTEYPGGLDDPEKFQEMVELFEAKEQRNYYYETALETVEQEFEGKWYRSDELVLGGPMLLMYTWNFAAQKTKALDKDEIQDVFEEHHEAVESARGTSLLDADLSKNGEVEEFLKAVWPDLTSIFDQTGTSKILSLLGPELFVMWDQDIRTRRRRKQDDPPGEKHSDRGVYFYMKENGYEFKNNSTDFGKDVEDYIVFLRFCQDFLEEIGVENVVGADDVSAAKRLDEAMYAFYKLKNG